MQPTDKASFAQFLLRKLGAPVIPINVSEEQTDDIIDQALYYYAQYHMDGQEKTYYSYAMTSEDIANGYITLPSNIIGAISIFPVGQSIGTNSLFNMRYQFIINDLYNFSNVSLVPFYMAMNHIQFMEEILIGQKPIRYNRHNNILYLDMDMSIVCEGQFIVVEAYAVIDPAVYPNVWIDYWLQKYATSLLKRQWAQNLKVITLPLPGGARVAAQQMYDEADREVNTLEHDMIRNFSNPPAVMIG
jgi:hypothetical protein